MTKQIVRKLLGKQVETKYRGDWYRTVWAYMNSQILGANQWYPCLPSVLQGTDEHQRVGDSVVPKKIQTKILLRLIPEDVDAQFKQADAKDVSVVIYYGYVRRHKSIPDVMAASADVCNNLLDYGDGTNTTFDGTMENSQLPLNVRAVNMKRKVIRLVKGHGNANSQSADGRDTQLGFPYREQATVTLRFKHKSKFKYDASADPYPQDYAPVVAFGYITNGQEYPPNAGGTSPVQYKILNQMWYTDM